MAAGRVAISLALLAVTAACASKQVASATDPVRKGVTGAVASPLKDVGVLRDQIPAPLAAIGYPYSNDKLYLGCQQVQYEIGQLDAVLGVESYQPGRSKTLGDKAVDAASDAIVDAAVGATQEAIGVIPFREWVRKASGADKNERAMAGAIERGHTRRTFLRGYGAALGCPGVVPAPPPEGARANPAAPPPQARDRPTAVSPR